MKRRSILTHEDRMRMALSLPPYEAIERLKRLRDREASLVTIVDVGTERLLELRGEIAEIERVTR